MAFHIMRNDITKVQADAIVNTANPKVLIGAGAEAAIYEAAGKKELLAAREKLGLLPMGTVGVTPAFHLKARYIIHASGPRWEGGKQGETEVLRACYKQSLKEALHLGCTSIAFPLLATGTYEFPREEALRIALDSFGRFLEKHDMEIFLVVFDRESVSVSDKLFHGLREYIDENYVAEALEEEYRDMASEAAKSRVVRKEKPKLETSAWMGYSYKNMAAEEPQDENTKPESVDKLESVAKLDMAENQDLYSYIETANDLFCQYLQQLINKKGYKNSQVYKKANLTKQYFSKLMNGQINPTKEKLLSISIALELNLDETKDMLMMAGYAISPCSKVDLVVVYFIRHKKYNMFDIEIALCDLGLPTLSNY